MQLKNLELILINVLFLKILEVVLNLDIVLELKL